MSASAMSPAPLTTLSSMEMMLDSIRRRDEQQPIDIRPPPLPLRPRSKGRLPSAASRLLRSQRLCFNEGGYDKVRPSEERRVFDDAPNLELLLNNEKAPVYCQQLKEGVINLQSFVRGERSRNQCILMHKRSRAAIMIQKNARRWLCTKTFHQHRKNAVLLQSVIRGLLARKHFLANQVKVDRNTGSHAERVKDTCAEHSQLHLPVVAELQMQVLEATAALKQKEEENITLQKQLQQYATRLSGYEAKMKAIEESWRKQMTSLQASLIIAKKGLSADAMSQPGKVDGFSMGTYDDSEEFLSAENRTPESTPAKQQLPVCGSAPLDDGNFNAVGLLLLEFEQRKEGFEDDMGILVEVKPKETDEEVRKVKSRFATWKKDVSARLRETKCALRKLGNLEPRAQRTWWWWGKRTAAAKS